MLDFVFAQPGVRPVHVRHDDGDVLKPAIVALRIHGHRAAARCDELHQLDPLIAQPQCCDREPHAENTVKALVLLA